MTLNYPKIVTLASMGVALDNIDTPSGSPQIMFQPVPASKMLDILITIIFGSQTIKLTAVEKRCELREYELILVHMQTFEVAKVQIQVRSLLEQLVKDFISAISKNDLPTLTGQ